MNKIVASFCEGNRLLYVKPSSVFYYIILFMVAFAASGLIYLLFTRRKP